MIICKITGTVVSTRKDENLEGFKFYIVEELNPEMNQTGKSVVAVDIVGAGIGEVVMVAQGSSARQSSFTDGRSVDATVIGIIDAIEVEGNTKYKKD